MGTNGEIFKLADGTLWEVKYEYEYLYEYFPSVVICPTRGVLIIGKKKLNVELISSVAPVDFGKYDPSPLTKAGKKVAKNIAEKNRSPKKLTEQEEEGLVYLSCCLVGYCSYLLILGLLPSN